uniref:Uncharacterized protein n=1 Tax=Caenorhabditis tropicalis TaxID=1561998 RepID=A0A1I7UXM1_9PELO
MSNSLHLIHSVVSVLEVGPSARGLLSMTTEEREKHRMLRVCRVGMEERLSCFATFYDSLRSTFPLENSIN